MPVKAIAKGINISHRKVGDVVSLVRERTVKDALTILDHTPRRSALAVKKVIESAKANAEHDHNYKGDTLRIVSITVSPGPSLKRFRPVSRGMAHPYQHRTSHISVIVDGEQRPVKKPAADSSAKEKK